MLLNRFFFPNNKFCLITVCHFQAAYDKICEAKKREAKRDRELDEQRKKFKLGESLTLKASFVCLLKCLFCFLAHQNKKKKKEGMTGGIC